MVPDFYLVGDGKTGESAVHRAHADARSRCAAPDRADGTMLLTNHALAPPSPATPRTIA